MTTCPVPINEMAENVIGKLQAVSEALCGCKNRIYCLLADKNCYSIDSQINVFKITHLLVNKHKSILLNRNIRDLN